MQVVLYIGGFELPDCNAAAQRVVSIAKGLKEIGHETVFLNYSKFCTMAGWKTYFDFPCYEAPKRSMLKHLTNIEDVKRVVREKKVTCIIAYNYPAICMSKLLKYCKKYGIRCYADATEWYVAQGSLLFRLIKTIDTECRMRFLHKKMEGIIAISEYLYQYYKCSVNTVKISPTVDIRDEKWHVGTKKVDGITRLVYAGSPTAQKEQLNLIVQAVKSIEKIKPVHLKIIGITEVEYEKTYQEPCLSHSVEFCGRVSHLDAVRYVTEADWSIVIRDNNKVVQAGFPTKVAESISCGTPVIANRFSNIEEYLNEENSILCELDDLESAILTACDTRKVVDCCLFDYHNYLEELMELID